MAPGASLVSSARKHRIYHAHIFIPGIEYTDSVTIAAGITVLNQSIGVASNSTNLADSGLDGILG